MQKRLVEGVALQSGAEGGAGLTMDDAEEETPVRTIPIPLGPVGRSSGAIAKCSRSRSFRVNGRLIPLLPAGADLKLHSHPGGSASGFTTVQDLIPVESSPDISTRQSPPPPAHSTPVITAVVSGEAAERVFQSHSGNVPATGSRAPPPGTTATFPACSNPTAPPTLPLQGNLEPISPPDCQVCRSPYRLVAELRGFLCLCSPALADSLSILKKSKKQYLRKRRRRERYKALRTARERQSVSKAPKTRPEAGGGPSDSKVLPPGRSRTRQMSAACESEQLSSSAGPEQPEPLHSPQGKLVIMVEDFYYGSTPQAPFPAGRSAPPKPAGPYSCIHCPQTPYSNIRLMAHMQEHVSSVSLPGQRPMCPQCFRYCASPFQLQRHIQAVHQPAEQAAGTCKICELTFADEPAFLQHMKHTHRPGEMPYACQVCDFRSSFYSELWSHFERFHANTNHFLCRYCLKVLQSSSCYQQHFSIHQMKITYSCAKCRLHFLYAKERLEHVQLHHRTHLRPAQLSGIKPGTKVTVRTYSTIRTSEDKEGSSSAAPCKVVRVDLPSPTPEEPSKKLVESLGQLLFARSLDSSRQADDRSRCLECLSCFPDFRTHFPSLVHCSLCRFTTCCSLAYANHMINNHTIGRRKPHYNSIFQSDPRSLQTLRCTVCALTTHRGDVMANHLAEGRGHGCVLTSPCPPLSAKSERPGARSPESCSGQTGGSFVPIHLLGRQGGPGQLSVKVLPTRLSSSSSSPAMTVRFLGAPPQHDGSPLSPFQQRVVCSALLHGVSQACRRYQTPAHKIQSWIQQQEQRCSQTWYWSTEELAEWLLVQREQQLSVSEDALLQTALEALGEAHQSSCHAWLLDFLLRHQLGLNRGRRPCGSLPRSIVDNSRAFVELLSPQLVSRAPHLVAAMDEIPIFLNMERFRQQDSSALRLWGSSSDQWLFTAVLSALSDGSLLPPLLLFRGAPCSLPEGFPNNVLLEARPEGFTDLDCQDVWISKVWRPHTCARGSSSHLLMVDVHRGHLKAAFRRRLGSLGTSVVFIPSGCSSCVQPLDVCVTPVLQDFLQARWNQLVSQGGLDGLGLDQLALTLACWLSELSSILNSETHFLRRSFSFVSSLQSLEKVGSASWMLRDLSRVLLQPLDPLVLPSAPPPLQLLLIVQPEASEEPEEPEEP